MHDTRFFDSALQPWRRSADLLNVLLPVIRECVFSLPTVIVTAAAALLVTAYHCMYSGGSNSDSARSAHSLTLALVFVWLTDIVLALFVNSVFENTTGFCSTDATDKLGSFGPMIILLLGLMLPVVYYFHETALYNHSDEFDSSDSTGLGWAFGAYIAAQLLMFYVVINVFLFGPPSTPPTPAPTVHPLFFVSTPTEPPAAGHKGLTSGWQSFFLLLASLLFFGAIVAVTRFKRSKQ